MASQLDKHTDSRPLGPSSPAASVYPRVIQNVLEAAVSAGILEQVAAGALANRFGIGRGSSSGKSPRLPESIPLALFEAIATLARSDHGIGALLALHADQRAFGVVGEAVLQSPSLADAYNRISRYSRLLHQSMTVTVTLSTSRFVVDCAFTSAGREPLTRAQAASSLWTMTNLAQVAQRTFGQHLLPQLTELSCSAPTDQAAIRDIFGPKVRFDAPRCRLTFSRHDVEMVRRPLKDSVLTYLDALAERDLGEVPPLLDIVEVVAVELRRGLVGCVPTIGEIACSLGLSQRTLQRRIREQGANFAGIVDSVRKSRAKELLAEDALPMSEIAYRLGYSEQASFSRAARRWFGVSPRHLVQDIKALAGTSPGLNGWARFHRPDGRGAP